MKNSIVNFACRLSFFFAVYWHFWCLYLFYIIIYWLSCFAFDFHCNSFSLVWFLLTPGVGIPP